MVSMAAARDYLHGPRFEYVLGVDLGQSIDPTALVLAERECFETGEHEPVKGKIEGATNWRRELAVRFRFRAMATLPLGTVYQDAVAEIAARFKQTRQNGKIWLVFDETGARAAGDMIRAEIPDAVGCTLTASESDQRGDNRRWSVSKANMVTALFAAIENREVTAAENLADWDTFKAHLVDLRRKISNLGHMSFNAREGAHDDYVTAAGLAFWYAKNRLGADGARAVKIEGF